MSDPGPAAPAHGPRPAASVLVNVTANFGGQVVATLLGVLCVPIYLRLLGAEAVGLIGFSLGLQALLRVLDMGLSPAVVRQMARLGGQADRWDELAEFFGTFERLFAGAALGIAAITVALSPLVAAHWLRGEQLPQQQVMAAVAIISVQSSVLFVAALYQGALMGLERQVLANGIRVAEACVSQIGAVVLLSFWMPRVEVLFGWQLAVSLIALACYGRAARTALPSRRPGQFRFAQVRGVWLFAIGMAGITATGTVLSNMDKVLLSRFLRLESFGHYTIASFATTLMAGLLVAPVFNALFPRSCAMVERGDETGQRRLYHTAIQVLVTVVWPVAAIFWVFARDLLQLWVHDRDAALAAEGILPFLAAGVALNTVMVPAYMIQLSHAWTALGFRLNLVLIAVFAPLLYLLTVRWGARGAAANFALMQGAYLLAGLLMTHRRLLKSALGEVVLRDLLPGIALCLVAAASLTALRDTFDVARPALRYAAIFGSWMALTAGTAMVSARVRPMLSALRGANPF